LWIILSNLNEHADLSAACLVNKKWFAIVGHKLDPSVIRQSEFDLINSSNHIFLRNVRTLYLWNVNIDNVSEYFECILQSCKIVHFWDCKFTSSQALQKVLKSCKNLDYLEIDDCSFEIGVIEAIITDTDIQCRIEHAEIKRFSWSINDYNSWKLIQTFDVLGIQLNNLNLMLMADEFGMELIEYIKKTYATKLKKLIVDSRRICIFDEFFQFLIDWDDLKLDEFGCILWEICRNISKFVEKQTSLKKIFGDGNLINIDKCPGGLESLQIHSGDIARCRSTINKICRLKKLHVFHLYISRTVDKHVLDFDWLKQMVDMEDFDLRNNIQCLGAIVFMMQEFNKPLQKMKILKLDNVIMSNQAMQAIIKNMPNLESLKVGWILEVSA
jgi:hypothetical protein